MKLLERCRQALRVKHFSYRTEQAYLHWVERFIRFHASATRIRWRPPRSKRF